MKYLIASILALLTAFTGWTADVNITNVTVSTNITSSDYVLGLTNGSVLAASKSRLIPVRELQKLTTNAINAVVPPLILAQGTANSNYTASVQFTTGFSNTIINLASNANWVSSNYLQGEIVADGISTIDGFGTNTTIVSGATAEFTNIVVTNLYAQNLNTDTNYVGTMIVSNSITASNITATTGFVGNGSGITNLNGTNITGVLTNTTTGNAGISALASNIVAGAILNAANGAALTNLHCTTDSSLATAATQLIDMSQDRTVAVTNAVAGNVEITLTNIVDRRFFVLRALADGSARTLSFLCPAATMNWVSTNSLSDGTNVAVTASKIATVVGRAWITGATTNIDLFANVQP